MQDSLLFFTGHFDKTIKKKNLQFSQIPSQIQSHSKNNPVKHNYMWDWEKQERMDYSYVNLKDF